MPRQHLFEPCFQNTTPGLSSSKVCCSPSDSLSVFMNVGRKSLVIVLPLCLIDLLSKRAQFTFNRLLFAHSKPSFRKRCQRQEKAVEITFTAPSSDFILGQQRPN